MRGTLPWRRIKGSTVRETWDLIHQKKAATAPYLFLGLPEEFEIFYTYVRGLEFADEPDYEGLRKMFRGLMKRKGLVDDGGFDWIRRPRHYDELTTEDSSKRVRRCRACEASAKAREADTLRR